MNAGTGTYNYTSDKIRTTCGTVLKYSIEKGYGFIRQADDKWNDAFVSYREVEPDSQGLKKLKEGDFVEFDLHQGSKGYFAKRVSVLTQEQYEARTIASSDSKFNR